MVKFLCLLFEEQKINLLKSLNVFLDEIVFYKTNPVVQLFKYFTKKNLGNTKICRT